GAAATARAAGVAAPAAGRPGLRRTRPLEQVRGDPAGRLALGRLAPAAGTGVARALGGAAGLLGGRLLAGLFRSFAEVFGDLGHGSVPRSSDHSGPEMPPSLRTRQKWMAMKITIVNGSSSTWSTYQRSSVSVPISAPPSSTKRTWSPKTGVYPIMFVPTVTAHRASWSHGSR